MAQVILIDDSPEALVMATGRIEQRGGATQRGGPGSGHFGHEGRPGEIGGSLPSGAGGKASSEQVARLADDLLTRARDAEPPVTEALQGIAERVGGHIVGLDFRFKRPESLAGKIEREARQNGLTPEQMSEEITDALRYTIAWSDPAMYTDGVLAGIEALEDAGYVLYDTRHRNYWDPGDAYDGYNTVWVSPEGERFELQWHTDDSIDIKEEAHAIYERARQLPERDPEAGRLLRDMTALWDTYVRPDGWERLPGIRIAQATG